MFPNGDLCAVPPGQAGKENTSHVRKILFAQGSNRRYATTAPKARHAAPQERNSVDTACGMLETLCTTCNMLTNSRIPYVRCDLMVHCTGEMSEGACADRILSVTLTSQCQTANS